MSDETKPSGFQFDTRDLFFMIVVATVAGLLLRVGAGGTVAVVWLVLSSLVIFMAIRGRRAGTNPASPRLGRCSSDLIRDERDHPTS
jgi:hypothetical protein